MRIIKCDMCGEDVQGEYMEVYQRITEGIATGKTDVCLKCWSVFENTKRIPVVNFPSMEE